MFKYYNIKWNTLYSVYIPMYWGKTCFPSKDRKDKGAHIFRSQQRFRALESLIIGWVHVKKAVKITSGF